MKSTARLLSLIVLLTSAIGNGQSRQAPKISVIKAPEKFGGCGRYLYFPADYPKQRERYDFAQNMDEESWMNIDGEDIELTPTSHAEQFRRRKDRDSVGDRHSDFYAAGKTTVRIDYITLVSGHIL